MLRRRLRTIVLAIAASVSMAGTLPAWAQETVLVPVRVIYPGETVTSDMLEEVALRRHLNNPASVAMFWDQVDGKVAKRTLLPGRLINVSSVREPWLVEPGSPVKVVFIQGALEIAISGVPLQPGAAGDMVRVRNIDSGVTLSGTVMADGTIRVSSS